MNRKTASGWSNQPRMGMGIRRSSRAGWSRGACVAVASVVLAGLWGAPVHAAGLLIADGGFGGILQIVEHSVHVTINNGIAVTEVTQVFLNTEDREVEALYTFPVPADASVANFSMWLDGTEMVGEVVEKERAREIYESYKQRKKDPGLLEQVDYRTFEMRIYPIPAGAEQQVQIAYYQELDADDDWATYVYPLATATRPNVDPHVAGRFAMTIEVKSEVPIVAMESPSHADEFVFAEHSTAIHEASLETPEGSLAHDVVVAYHLSRPRTGIDVITSRQGGEDGYFCMSVTAGEELAHLSAPMDYVFVVDISGSMQSERKLDTSSNCVEAFVEALGREDRFEVLAFNVAPESLFGSLSRASEETAAQAHEFLESQRPRGGTVLRPALNSAYGYADPSGSRQLNVVILSDGITKQDSRAALLELVSVRPPNARVFCVGIGNDVNRALLEELAEDSGGLAAMISREDNFDRQARAFRRKLTRPAATDLNVTFSGVEVYDVVPEILPNLYHGTPVRLYGRYRGSGTVETRVEASVNGHRIHPTVELDFPEEDPGNPEIERMWAWHKVQRLLKQADRAGSRAEVLEEIVRLGEGYSIATEYTSFLVLENNEEYARWQIERRNALRIERDRQAQARLRSELDEIRMGSSSASAPEETAPTPATAPADPMVEPQRQDAARRTDSNSVDLALPGAGFIDPVAAALIAGLAATALAGRRQRKDR